MTTIFIIGEIFLALYIILEFLCVITYRRRLRVTIARDLAVTNFDEELEFVENKREAFFEGYRYLLEKLPEDFFKPKQRARLSRRITALINNVSDPTDDIPPEQEQSDDRG